ncbi:hypothetical protein TSOC_004337 [Tetrabaena socialis]|uniref:Protein kinase domain-containing protein n=1 Tax=Tetrabaena socialis TaxID=47790 RepID=A0A2J8A971_9CHLO|nr:hypothetical protein TSOC_004337 [Tetrabaena socialis]|eukprot:PNH09084.1 hypothetical protein TSOC_004337 [Tetrabaena socialis]
MLRLQDRLPPGVDPAVSSLLHDCLAEDPAARPSMEAVLQRLAGVRELPQPQGTGAQAAAGVRPSGGGAGEALDAGPGAGVGKERHVGVEGGEQQAARGQRLVGGGPAAYLDVREQQRRQQAVPGAALRQASQGATVLAAA